MSHTSQCRASDLPARLGGDEFAVIVDDEAATGVRLAHRLRQALGQAAADRRFRMLLAADSSPSEIPLLKTQAPAPSKVIAR